MAHLGLTFPGGYEEVSNWKAAEGAGGYATSRRQELYKPTKSKEAFKVCQALREGGSS
ncbi:hypothetical protein CDEF62S_04716 [Castellaniella defragrans]